MTDGVINVYKEKGMTSFSVVARLRRIFDQRKIGHAGTLDPDAEGVLPVCLGRATRLVERLSRTGTKTYEAVLLLGRTTDTQDISGKILKEMPVDTDPSAFRSVFFSFSGVQMQLPPMYSALKVNGKKLVDLARRGIEVERKPRPVEFSDMEVLSFEPPRAVIRVTCSHGAYIRTLCHDIGEKLGCGACLESLLRIRVGEFSIEEALKLDEISERKMQEDADGRKTYSFVRPPDDFFRGFPSVTVSRKVLRSVLNGSSFGLSDCTAPEGAAGRETCEAGEAEGALSFPEGSGVRAYSPDGGFLGVYRVRDGRCLLEQYFAADR